jgi:hypothetical protein
MITKTKDKSLRKSQERKQTLQKHSGGMALAVLKIL